MDIDVWIASTPEDARRVVAALEDFGFGGQKLSETMFLEGDRAIRMGLPPMRIEIMTSIDGVKFDDAYSERVEDEFEGVTVKMIGLQHLKCNKRAAARAKDLADVEELP